ncbi:hypothetical protein B3C1_02785 [Gallaecimonas xiamenensis 3-C-1]|uniref:DUF2970 domain-containing protein n=2 Tax=Gallaecimonas TaxID=745410 RepID=K2J290_9GAMM|nr:hypothetical protein B3C1_02785 [Gallaecimonas xiamenensis 3-C-1]
MSIAGAFFGVQSSERHAADFKSRSALSYIIAGVIGVVLFVVSLMLLVSWVLN